MGTKRQPKEWGDKEFEYALARAADGILHAPGIRLSAEQLDRLLDAAPREARNLRQAHALDPLDELLGTAPRRVVVKSANFVRAILDGNASFRGVNFTEDADFVGATFSGDPFFYGATFSGNAAFYQATFTGRAGFGDAMFRKLADFREARFSGGADFIEANFSQDAEFGDASFRNLADFRKATFGADAEFVGASFRRGARFDGATFSGDAEFLGATFSGDAQFDEATFKRDCDFQISTFAGDAQFVEAIFTEDGDFQEVTFRGGVAFDRVTFGQSANFSGSEFEAATEIGPIHVYERLWLDRVVFARPVRIEASALRASFGRTEFRHGADLRLRWAEVWLEDTEFAEPSLIAALPTQVNPDGVRADAFLGWEKPANDGAWCCPVPDEPPTEVGPRVLSLRGARVSTLALSGAHLEACRFAGAHGLDELGFERVEFPWPPSGWRWVRWLPVRWARRQTIAEEQYWRSQRGHGGGWDQSPRPTGSPDPWPPQPSLELDPDGIAGLYRQLRKTREDSRDEPGANDFYYGEMEMRRRSGPLAERTILWLYWLVSGYGLRASRALLALAITTAVLGAIPLTLWGFHPGRSYGPALLFALQSSISLLRAPTSQPGHETAGGQSVEIFLRLAGPLFFGLALLALRGRVKR